MRDTTACPATHPPARNRSPPCATSQLDLTAAPTHRPAPAERSPPCATTTGPDPAPAHPPATAEQEPAMRDDNWT